MDIISNMLFDKRDKSFAEFQARLIPSVPPEKIIGVRTPEIKKIATWMLKNGLSEQFIAQKPHEFFEENQLHAFIISAEKNYECAVKKTNDFLPQIDNWATCDQLRPRVFDCDRLIEEITRWIYDKKTYTVRFGIGMLMTHFLDKRFKKQYADTVSDIDSDEYYIVTMQAWYFATALSKRFDEILPYFSSGALSKEVNNKAIQKAVESFRISPVQKDLLRTFRRK